jgi:phospholipase C
MAAASAEIERARSSIDHIVALVLENRSFDHVLGDLGRSGALAVDGGRPEMANRDLNGQPIGISPVAFPVSPDLPHDFDSVTMSLMDENGGFVRADQLFHRGDPNAAPARVMSYFAAGTMPVTHALAREYAVSDQWFAAVPSGTWPNRLFLVAGSSGGRVTNTAPTLLFDMPTVFDRLPDDRWAVYNDQIPNVTLIRHLAFEWLADRVAGTHFRSLERFDRDCQDGRLPTFSYIEPAYLGDAADDSHPPRDVLPSERLVARIYRSLRRSPLWGRSILLILYDEHGGFFDHVRPPEDVPSPGTGERGFGFARLGIRIPCLLVSPLVARGQVWRPGDGRFADHTSLIASVLRFAGAAALTARDEGAADIWSVVTSQTPRDDDGPTLDTIETWLDGQKRLVTRAIPGPLDPDALQNASGRDVAAAIVQHAEIAPPTRAIETPERGTRAPQRPPADVPFEEALVTLAENILSLPPGSPRTDPPHRGGSPRGERS